MPASTGRLSLAEAMAYPAIELFVQRARAASSELLFRDDDSDVIADLCRHLDGMPLAIELAAARIDSLGLRGLAARMQELPGLLTRGRRTAPARHRTLHAVLDWSFELLAEVERKVLLRLSAFRAAFTLDAGAAVACDDDVMRPMVIETVLRLTERSLIARQAGDDVPEYRLLETTRAFASEKLRASGESQAVLARHAACMLDLMKQAQAEWSSMDPECWSARYDDSINDVQAAIDWCFSSREMSGLGVKLTAAALPLVYALGLLDNYHDRVAQALEHVTDSSPRDPAVELWLNIALVFPSGGNERPSLPHAKICARNLELAQELKEPRYAVTALHSVWVRQFRDGEYPAALRTVERLGEEARAADPLAVLLSERLTAQTRHFMGDHDLASCLAGHVLERSNESMPLGYISPVPPAVSMRIVLCRIHWLRGFPEQALRVANECLRLAASHPSAFTQALAMAACPVALWRGDDAQARDLVQQLTLHADRLGSAHWQAWSLAYQHALDLRDTARDDGDRRRAHASLQRMARAKPLDHATTCAPMAPAASTVARARDGTAGWCAAEVLRLEAETLRHGGGDARDIEARLSQAKDIARSHGELSWELRCARSLAEHLYVQGRVQSAHDLLAAVYDRFTEGFATRDLRAAREQIDHLREQLSC
jgi:predicted ATPase